MADSALRIDKFLWYARLAKTRGGARAIVDAGHVRIGGRRIERAHTPVKLGDVLSLPLHGEVRVIRVEALPARRGPAPEARACYTELLVGGPKNENSSQKPSEY